MITCFCCCCCCLFRFLLNTYTETYTYSQPTTVTSKNARKAKSLGIVMVNNLISWSADGLQRLRNCLLGSVAQNYPLGRSLLNTIVSPETSTHKQTWCNRYVPISLSLYPSDINFQKKNLSFSAIACRNAALPTFGVYFVSPRPIAS